MLKKFVKSLDEVDEKYRDLYEEADGGFRLKVDDKEDREKLNEFRSNNTRMKKKLEELEAQMKQFEGLDPSKREDYQKALDQLNEMKDKALLDEGKVEELIERRTKTMREQFDKEIKAKTQAVERLTQEAQAMKAKLRSISIDTAIRNAISEVGSLRPSAIEDVYNRARSVWDLDEEGNLVGKDLFDEKGNPMTMTQYAQKLLQDAPHLFEASTGGDGGGGRKNNSGGSASKVLRGSDPIEFGRHLEEIASGKVQVTD
jgi:DNA repair exonuclease SbcCD ATPase subunit